MYAVDIYHNSCTDLSSILGNIHQLDDTSTWFLKTELLQRLPADVCVILSAFHSKPLIDLAKMANSIMLHECPSTSASAAPNNVFVPLVYELFSSE